MKTGIILWWHSTIASIPVGWHLCDGTAGTPDLRDQFVIAAKQDDAGVAKATIEGTLKQSGGTEHHKHTLSMGTIILDSTPEGQLDTQVGSTFHYPPCYALPLIMKL